MAAALGAASGCFAGPTCHDEIVGIGQRLGAPCACGIPTSIASSINSNSADLRVELALQSYSRHGFRMGWRSFSTFMALCLLAATPGPLAAAAWTREPGQTFVSLTASVLEPGDSDTVRDATLAAYAEYGFAEGLTLGGAIEWKIDRDATAFFGGQASAEGDVLGPSAINAAAFVRMRLHEGAAGDPLSFQMGIIGSLDEPDRETGLFAEERAFDVRLLYGRGFGTAWGDAWFGGEGALRVPVEGGATEFRLDLTAGIRPLPALLLYVQSFGTLGFRNAEPGGSDYDELKLAPSIGYDLGTLTFVAGVERTVTGRNVGKDTRFKLSIWRQF